MSSSSFFLSSSYLFLFLLSTNLRICLTVQTETGVVVARQNETSRLLVHIGAVLDMKSPMDRMVNVCLSMALSDFYAAQFFVIGLLKSGEVHAILGLQRSAESSFVKKLGEKAFVPIISISSTGSSPSPSNNPYFIKIGQDESSQLKAISSLFQNFGWNEVILIYEEDMEDHQIELFSCLLANSSLEIAVLVAYKSLINPKANESEILNELNVLKSKETKVFVVHMSVDLGSRFFALAKREKMISKGFAWIITDSLSYNLEAMDPSVVDSMEGVIGIQPRVPKSIYLDRFKSRYEFDRQHSMSEPNMVKISGLNIFGLWAYDTIWALAMAAEKIAVGPMDSSFSNTKNNEATCSTNLADLIGTSKIGPKLLDEVSNMTSFQGLSGDFELVDGQLSARALEVFNLIDKMKIVIGYWIPENGYLTKHLCPVPNISMTNELKSIIWQGYSKETPLRWAKPTLGKKLIKIGVPITTNFTEFVNLKEDKGLSLEVFKAVLDALPFKLYYRLEPSKATNYDELCYHVYNKTYDAVVGDITILASRTNMVDFTLPYLDSRVTMLIKIKGNRDHIWTFLQPLSWDLWLMLLISCCSVGVVVRILERRVNEEFKGPASKQITTILLFPVQSVVIPQREMVTTYCSKVVLLTWLFLAFVIMQSYTGNLSSILTVDRLQGRVPSFKELRKSIVCYHKGSFVKDFLIQKLNFKERNLKSCTSIGEFHEALSNNSCVAIFDEIPYIKLFLMKHSSGFKTVEMNYKTIGFGFAFQLGSRLTPNFSRAILNVTQGPKMSDIEQKYFKTEDIYGDQPEAAPSTSSSLTTKSFGGFFLLEAIIILLALLISERRIWERFVMRYLACASPENNTQSRVHSMAEDHDIHRLQENVDLDHNVEMIDNSDLYLC